MESDSNSILSDEEEVPAPIGEGFLEKLWCCGGGGPSRVSHWARSRHVLNLTPPFSRPSICRRYHARPYTRPRAFRLALPCLCRRLHPAPPQPTHTPAAPHRTPNHPPVAAPQPAPLSPPAARPCATRPLGPLSLTSPLSLVPAPPSPHRHHPLLSHSPPLRLPALSSCTHATPLVPPPSPAPCPQPRPTPPFPVHRPTTAPRRRTQAQRERAPRPLRAKRSPHAPLSRPRILDTALPVSLLRFCRSPPSRPVSPVSAEPPLSRHPAPPRTPSRCLPTHLPILRSLVYLHPTSCQAYHSDPSLLRAIQTHPSPFPNCRLEILLIMYAHATATWHYDIIS